MRFVFLFCIFGRYYFISYVFNKLVVSLRNSDKYIEESVLKFLSFEVKKKKIMIRNVVLVFYELLVYINI